MKRQPTDPELLRDRLREAQGKNYWRSLAELEGDPDARDMLEREFPNDASVWADGPSRRRFIKLMGASFALAGLASTGCRPPTGQIYPYVRQPENLVLGKPLYYATSMTIGGCATGLLVESHEGRPTKIEGNPQHPASKGASDQFHQAAMLDMYDPDRSQSPSYRSDPRSYGAVVAAIRDRLRTKGGKGAGFAVLAPTIGSPTLRKQKADFLAAYPEARWYTYEPVNADNARAGAALAFGAPFGVYHKLEQADVIVALDSDFLAVGPAHLANTREFSSRRRGDGDPAKMNRLYAVESDLTVTGAAADNRLPLTPSRIDAFARTLAAKLGVSGAQAASLDDDASRWATEIAKDLSSRGAGKTAVIVGDGQPAAVHAIGHAINAKLGNLGKTVVLTDGSKDAEPRVDSQLNDLFAGIDKGDVTTLLVLGGNPAYTTPANLNMGDLLARQLKNKPSDAWMAFHLGTHFDETARLCHWHINEAHFLEQWSDGVAYDGTVGIVQPLIAPLYDGHSAHELISSLTPTKASGGEGGDYENRAGLDLVKSYWRDNLPPSAKGQEFEKFWQKTLHDGVMAGTARPPASPSLVGDLFAKKELAAPAVAAKGYELQFTPDPAVFDGRSANNGWLQELPKPVTRLTWDNGLMVSPKTAKDLGVKIIEGKNPVGDYKGGEHGESFGDFVLVKIGTRSLEVPVWIVPGHADGAMTLHLGGGRTHAGRVGNGVGFNANKLRTVGDGNFVVGVSKPERVRERPVHSFACVQAHHSMEGRNIIISGSVAERLDPKSAYTKHLKHARHDHHGKADNSRRLELPTLYKQGEKDFPYDGYKWGMAVDLSACIGCSACVVACQAENNIPVIGKDQVLRGREMHWMRIDRYFETPADRHAETGKDEKGASGTSGEKKDHSPSVKVHFQPVMCQHCETAPCEVVCPVEATAHGDEGTNDMAYNRCVGTRYCANNCPYKVRRFNFLQYTDYDTPSLKLLNNPDVTVRTRGVMEKCSFCIQRVAAARIEAAKDAMDELRLPESKRKRRDTNGPDGGPRLDRGREIPLIRDGEVVSACQSSCPAGAIVFGDLNDKSSRVRKLHDLTTNYELLGELGTRPRVTYLAAVRNPNPALEVTAHG